MESNVLRYYLKKETQIFRSKFKSNASLYKVQQKCSDYVTFNALKVTKSFYLDWSWITPMLLKNIVQFVLNFLLLVSLQQWKLVQQWPDSKESFAGKTSLLLPQEAH